MPLRSFAARDEDVIAGQEDKVRQMLAFMARLTVPVVWIFAKTGVTQTPTAALYPTRPRERSSHLFDFGAELPFLRF